MIHPHKASRTPRKNPVTLHHGSLPPRIRPTACARVRSASGGGAFDVIVEAFDDVAGARFFEVGGFVAKDLIFESGLGGGEVRRRTCQGDLAGVAWYHILV